MVKPRPTDPADQTPPPSPFWILPPAGNQLLLAPANNPSRWLLFVSFTRRLTLPLRASIAPSSGFSLPRASACPLGFDLTAQKMPPVPQAAAGPKPCAAPSPASKSERRSVVQRRRCRVTAADLVGHEPIKRLHARTFSLE